MEVFNFSFTFTIPAFKKIWYNGKSQQYGKMTQDKQYNFLENLLQKIISVDDKILWIYEEHEDSRLHIHGYIYNTHFDYMAQIRDKFYSHHSIGIAVSKYVKISDIQQTSYHPKFFVDYMNKHQDKIKFYQSNIQQIKNCNDLDGKSTKFDEYLIKTNDDKYYYDNIVFDHQYDFSKYLHPYTKIERIKFLIDL